MNGYGKSELLIMFRSDIGFDDHAYLFIFSRSNGKVVKTTKKYKIEKTKTVRKLTIKSVQLTDQQEFTCACGNMKTSTKVKIDGM